MTELTSKLPSSPPRPAMHRSISEVSPPALKIHRPHHHHHHTHIHHHGRRAHSKEKNTKEEEPQSAHPNLQPFLGGERRDKSWRDIQQARSEGVTPAGSRNASRRTSVLGSWESDGGPSTGTAVIGDMALGPKERKAVKDGQVKQERERGVLRATFVTSRTIHESQC